MSRRTIARHRGQRKAFPLVHTHKSRVFRGVDLPDDAGTKGNESRFVRCQWCGAINDTELRPRGDGWGGNISKADTGATETTLYYDVVGGAGCWFCGSSNYY